MYGMYQGALHGWREPGVRPGPVDTGTGADDFAARVAAYRLYWAFYDQSAFRDATPGMTRVRSAYGMYDGVRDLMGVAYQLGEFWPTYLFGGTLDPMAGDGKAVPSALPILMDAEVPAVRDALAELWKRSRLQSVKETAARYGVVFGDVFWQACDDFDARTVRLSAVNPGHVRWVDVSCEGNVEAYELEYWRPDPRVPARPPEPGSNPAPWVLYNERVEPAPGGGPGYRYQTYLDHQKYEWPGSRGADVVVPDLPFAPLVKVQHKDVGTGWGRSEAASAMTGMREVSDLTSCLTDWARRALNAPHLMAGMADPATDPGAQARAAAAGLTPAQQRATAFPPYGSSQSQVEAVRTSNAYLWTGAGRENVKAQSLVHPMPVDGVGGQIDRLRNKMIEDYPELQYERQRATAHVSGETLRQARKPAESKILARRVTHDEGIERAMKMCLTLGGLAGYRHYEGFDAASYEGGGLDFRIDGGRPAFPLDPTETNADLLGKYTAIAAAVAAGVPHEQAWLEAGYSEADVEKMSAAKAKADADALKMAQAMKPPPAAGQGRSQPPA